MEYRILGQLEVREDPEGPPLDLGGHTMRSVLAVLLLHANSRVSNDCLGEAVWGDPSVVDDGDAPIPADADHALRQLVCRLRKVLGDPAEHPRILLTESRGYHLRVHPGELDSERFVALVEQAQRAIDGGHADDASDRLDAADHLWRGPPLGEFANMQFAHVKIAELEESRTHLDRLRASCHLDAGRIAQAIMQLKRLLAVNPTDEGLVAQLMRALYACGRQAEALQAYEEVRVQLDAAVGARPGPELRDLVTQILTHDPVLDRVPPPARHGEPDDARGRRAVDEQPQGANALAAPAVEPDHPRQGWRRRGGGLWRRLRAPSVVLLATVAVLATLAALVGPRMPASDVPDQDPVAIAQACLVAFVAGDRVGLERVLARRAVFVEVARGTRIVHRGKPRVTRRLLELRSYFSNVRYVVTDRVVRGGVIRSDIRWSVRQTTPFPDGSTLAGDGVVQSLEDHVTTTVEHGRITSIVYRRYAARTLDGAA